MTSAPSLTQVRAQVQSIREKPHDARAIAIRLPSLDAAMPVPATLRIDGEELPVFQSDSVLALRERLVDLPDDSPPLVVLTDLPEPELGDDLLARFAHRRVFAIDPWQLVKERFKALNVDPRLATHHDWAARALLDAEPEAGYAPVPSGFLDAETAWRHLFETIVGTRRGERDPEALLAWALEDTPADTLSGLSDAVQTGLAEAVGTSAGPAARVIFECAARLGRRAVSVGLVARVLFDPDSTGDERAAKARGKLEALLGLPELDAELARAWTDGAERVVLRRRRTVSADAGEPESRALVDAVLADADLLLQELGSGDLAWRSRMLQASLDQRRERLGLELATFVEGDAEEVPKALRDAAASVLDHARSVDESERATGVEMALRLAGWLAARRRGTGREPSFREAARAYRSEGCFVDWARRRLWDGDPKPLLGRAYASLARLADAARHEENREFGKFLAGWPGTESKDQGLLGVEAVLDHWVVPLAREHRVLFLVIDAMSMPVFRELEQDLAWRGWVGLVPDQTREALIVIAALPTVTEASRTSLLCGGLGSGNAAREKDGFAAHAGLRSTCATAVPPVLFHKADLREAGAAGLSPKVAEAIAEPDRRVVGVVINAVDDHLAKGDQVPVPWIARHIRPLDELLEICRASGRVVILASDHGHVLERETELRDVDGAERWRPATGVAAEDEVLLQGPRVIAPSQRLLAPWSERVRFGMKKNGYHGGATLQEVVLPLGIFAPPDTASKLAGWREAASEHPAWWQWRVETGAAAEPERLAPSVDRPAPTTVFHLPGSAETGDLLAQLEPKAPEPAETWIDRLFESDLFAAQREHAARTALPDERIRTILAELERRGGKLTTTALAQNLGVPQFRLMGIVSALRRVLNVDGYDVVSVDEASETVELNRELLDAQFALVLDGM